MTLVVLATHPVQYHAPVYRTLQQQFGIPVTAIYGSDFSVAGYRDPEFGASVRWDTDLVSGYTPRFLERSAEGGAATTDAVTGKGLASLLQESHPTAILLTGYQGTFHRRAWLAALQAGVPLFFRAETNDEAVQRGSLKSIARDTFLRFLYSRCTALLPIGIHSRHHYQRLAPKTATFVAPYCVDTTPFQSDEAARLQYRAKTRIALSIQEEQIAILFSGKLIAKKNPLLLIRAVQQLPQPLRDKIVVVFLGDGELRAEVEALATTAPVVATRFVGFQNQSVLSPYYHAADLMVLPSAFGETWGLVVNESLHHGVPAIVSNRVGCAPDLIVPHKTGAIFASESATELAEALQAIQPLLGNVQTRTDCRTHVEGYSVTAAAEGIATAFHAVVKR